MKVITKILPSDFDYTDQANLYDQMPANIKAVLSNKNSPKRMISLLGWELLRDNLQDPTLLQKVEFEEKGKPYIPGLNIHFNISNTKGVNTAIVLVLSNAPVGIDIEKLREPKENIYHRVFNQEEVEAIKCAEDFTRLWTRKEAVVKLFGGGISMGLTGFSVLNDEVEAFGKKVEISEVEISGFTCHVASFAVV